MTGVSPAERRRISLTAIGEFLLVVLFVVSLPVLFIWTLWLFWAVLAAALAHQWIHCRPVAQRFGAFCHCRFPF